MWKCAGRAKRVWKASPIIQSFKKYYFCGWWQNSYKSTEESCRYNIYTAFMLLLSTASSWSAFYRRSATIIANFSLSWALFFSKVFESNSFQSRRFLSQEHCLRPSPRLPLILPSIMICRNSYLLCLITWPRYAVFRWAHVLCQFVAKLLN